MAYQTAALAIQGGESIHGRGNVKAVHQYCGFVYVPKPAAFAMDSAGHAVKEAATASGPIDFRRLSIKGLRQLAKTASEDEFVKTFDAWITANNSTNVAVVNDSAVDISMRELAVLVLSRFNKKYGADGVEEEQAAFGSDHDIYAEQYAAAKAHHLKIHHDNVARAKKDSDAARSRFNRKQ